MSETISSAESIPFSPDVASVQEYLVAANDEIAADETEVFEETSRAVRHLARCMELHAVHENALEQWLIDDYDGKHTSDVLEGVLDIIEPLVLDKLEGAVKTQEEKIYGGPHVMLDQLLGYRLLEQCTFQQTVEALRNEFGNDVSEREVACLQQMGLWVLGKAAVERRRLPHTVSQEVQNGHKETDTSNQEQSNSFEDGRAQRNREASPEVDAPTAPVSEGGKDESGDFDGALNTKIMPEAPGGNVSRQDAGTPVHKRRQGRTIKSRELRSREKTETTGDAAKTTDAFDGNRSNGAPTGSAGGANQAEWANRAACRVAEPDIFFPEKGGSTREAKRICATCEVVRHCLQFALENDERFGIWGGMSERERRKIKRMKIGTG